MSFEPEPGLVIRYDFLWKDDADKGAMQGRKDRPCAIILATAPKPGADREVLLCPITHSAPKAGETAVEIPVKMARHLNLDDERSWLKTNQLNTIVWPENQLPFGVVPAHKNRWVFGHLHKSLAETAFEQVRENSRAHRLKNVRREHESFPSPKKPSSNEKKNERDR